VNSCLTRCWQQNRQTHAQVNLGAMGKNELTLLAHSSLARRTQLGNCWQRARWREQFCCFYFCDELCKSEAAGAGGVRRAARTLEKTTPSQEGLGFPYWKSNRRAPIQTPPQFDTVAKRESPKCVPAQERKGERRKAGPASTLSNIDLLTPDLKIKRKNAFKIVFILRHHK
jgi:hypothetical protein